MGVGAISGGSRTLASPRCAVTKDSVTAVAYFADSTRVASAGRDGSVRIWDLATGDEEVKLVGHEGGFEALAISPEGTYIAAGGHDHRILLWKVATGELLGTLTGHRSTVTTLAFSPNGQWLVSGGQDHQLIVWDATTHAVRLTLGGHAGECELRDVFTGRADDCLWRRGWRRALL